MTLIYPPFFVTDFLETLSGRFQLLDERVILELQILPLSLCIQCLHLTQSLKKKTVRYFVTRWAFKISDPLKSSPDSHSQLVRGSVDITSSCSLLAFPFSKGSQPCIIVVSASYLELVIARLLIVLH